mmetsp:Transcript_23774/g.77396  ORF Transcript_23774/g.77396 Transcript_23774/m.77396 type:complete len:145 (-) Transcript_23774:139-573(-)
MANQQDPSPPIKSLKTGVRCVSAVNIHTRYCKDQNSRAHSFLTELHPHTASALLPSPWKQNSPAFFLRSAVVRTILSCCWLDPSSLPIEGATDKYPCTEGRQASELLRRESTEGEEGEEVHNQPTRNKRSSLSRYNPHRADPPS